MLVESSVVERRYRIVQAVLENRLPASVDRPARPSACPPQMAYSASWLTWTTPVVFGSDPEW
jgi:hypothetical protein